MMPFQKFLLSVMNQKTQPKNDPDPILLFCFSLSLAHFAFFITKNLNITVQYESKYNCHIEKHAHLSSSHSNEWFVKINKLNSVNKLQINKLYRKLQNNEKKKSEPI